MSCLCTRVVHCIDTRSSSDSSVVDDQCHASIIGHSIRTITEDEISDSDGTRVGEGIIPRSEIEGRSTRSGSDTDETASRIGKCIISRSERDISLGISYRKTSIPY